MPSRNSINKPKDKILKNSHASTIGKRRSNRVRLSTRSSHGRYNDNTLPTPRDSKAVALYTGKIPITTELTTKTLSNKKAKKLARNQKYNEKRKELLTKDIDSKMEVEDEKKVKESEAEKLRVLLWNSIKSNDLLLFKKQPDTEGTTIGVQSF